MRGGHVRGLGAGAVNAGTQRALEPPQYGPVPRRPPPPGRRWAIVLGVLLASGCRGGDAQVVPVLPKGAQLAERLDAMHVESHWIAGHHVRWRTGDPDGRPEPPEGYHSHCSAFVAAFAEQLGVEILHPPEHTQVLLANAQCAWLAHRGARVGWRPVATPLEAQQEANRGMLVLACHSDPDPALPGHIAVVRPDALSRRRIESDGPQVTQAGIENYRSTSLARGFRNHPQAWPRRAIRFFAHDVTL
jgi:hypothetical protein